MAKKCAPKTITPFADDACVLTFGEFTVENGSDRIAVYGSLGLTRDEVGLEHARVLHGIFRKTVAALEGDQDLPDEALAPEKPSEVKNPFARASASMSAAEFHAGAIMTEAVDVLLSNDALKGRRKSRNSAAASAIRNWVLTHRSPKS